MTVQHLLYIPVIFLLGFLFGSILNQSKPPELNDQFRYRTSAKTLLNTLIIFLLVFVITHMFPVPWGAKEVSRQLGDLPIFDRSPVFSGKEVYNRVAKFSVEGIRSYMRFTYTVDVLFPLSFFLFLSTLSRFAFQRITGTESTGKWLKRLPGLWLVADLLENAIVYTLLSRFPERHEVVAGSLGFVTVMKYGLLILSIVLPIYFFVVANNRAPLFSFAALLRRRKFSVTQDDQRN